MFIFGLVLSFFALIEWCRLSYGLLSAVMGLKQYLAPFLQQRVAFRRIAYM